MNLDLEIEFSKATIFAELDALKKQIDDQRPLAPDVEGRVMQKLRLDWNYNSNAIEGNKLTYGETVAFLMEGITAKGKPLKDHLDIRGHNEAIHFLTELIKDSRGITEADIRALHKMILVERYKVDAQTADGKSTTKWVEIGEYKSMANHVQTSTGEIHYYASPEDVRLKMPELIEWYNEANSNKAIHPVVIAALFHHNFVAIHPFDDGNGRLSRVLMNLILMQNGFPPAIVKMDDRKNYYALLNRADNGDSWPFVEYISQRTQKSLNIYIIAIDGGDIDEDDDIDKDIALFKTELKNYIKIKDKKSQQIVKKTIDNEFIRFLDKVLTKIRNFSEFYISENFYINFFYNHPDYRTPMTESYTLDAFKSQMINTKELSKDYRQLNLTFDLNEFRNPDNVFNTSISIILKFNEYDYCFINDDGTTLTKLYHESITNEELNFFLKALVKSTKAKIKESIES